ncbi:uncharacterized protein METZ01_LOCUS514072, partial [marine metagenome]
DPVGRAGNPRVAPDGLRRRNGASRRSCRSCPPRSLSTSIDDRV